jgi:hypothetical protein
VVSGGRYLAGAALNGLPARIVNNLSSQPLLVLSQVLDVAAPGAARGEGAGQLRPGSCLSSPNCFWPPHPPQPPSTSRREMFTDGYNDAGER